MSDAMREAAERKLRQMSGEEAGGNPSFHKWEAGKNPFRFLPIPGKETEVFYEEVNAHFAGGEWFFCLTEKFFGKNQNIPSNDTRCPFCRRFNQKRNVVNKKYGRDTDEGKAAFSKVAYEWRPAKKYYVVGYDPESEDPEVKVASLGSQIFTALLTEYVEGGIKFFDVRRGRTMTVVKKKKPGGTDPVRDIVYTCLRGEVKEDVSEVYEQVEDGIRGLLDDVLPKRKTPKEMEEFIKQQEIQYDDSDEGGGDEADDEDDPPPKKKGGVDFAAEARKAREAREAREKRAKADADEGPAKPKCFADPEVRDPEDDACQECPFFKRCGKAIAAAAEEPGEAPAPKKKVGIAGVKDKLDRKAGKKPPVDEDADSGED